MIPKLRAAAATDANAALALGVAYYMVRQYRLFEHQMRALIAADPANPAPYYYLGRYQDSDVTDFAAAAASFQEVLKRRPNHAKSHYYLGHALEAQGLMAEARSHFGRARAIDPGLALARDGLARLELAANNSAAALAHNPADLKLRGRILLRLERWAEAAKCLCEAVEADTTDSTLWVLLHRAYRELGEEDKAAEALVRSRLLANTY